MRKIYLLLAISLLPFTLSAQIIEGTIKDAKTNENLPYVNVGVVGKSLGTVTDTDGHYKLNLNGHTADTLRISMIGYQPKQFITGSFAANINANKVVMLQPEITQLKEVKVKNKKWKTATLGIVSRSQNSNVNFGSNKLGNELGALIKIKSAPTLIKKFNTYLTEPAADSVKVRLNFYSLKGGMPDKIVQQQNIFFTIAKGQQMIDIDLEQYNISVDENFFVSLEWIENSKGRGLSFAGRPFRGSVFVREASQADWYKSGWLGLGFNVLAEY